MSFRHVESVMNYSKTRGAARAILLCLAYRADEKGRCWPSLDRIARDAGLSKRGVTKTMPIIASTGELYVLHQNKAVQTRGGKQAVNAYQITLKGREHSSPPLASKVGNPVPKGREPSSSKVGNPVPSNSHRNSHLNRQWATAPTDDMSSPKNTAKDRYHGKDYSSAELPTIGDTPDIHNPDHDPILVACAVTGELGKPATHIKPVSSDWLESLKPDCVKQGINLDNELIKINRWLLARPNKRLTQRFVINWLNRCDKTIGGINVSNQPQHRIDKAAREYPEDNLLQQVPILGG